MSPSSPSRLFIARRDAHDLRAAARKTAGGILDVNDLAALRERGDAAIREMRASFGGQLPAEGAPERHRRLMRVRAELSALHDSLSGRSRDIATLCDDTRAAARRDPSAIDRLMKIGESLREEAGALRGLRSMVEEWFREDRKIRSMRSGPPGDPLSIRAHASLSERACLHEISGSLKASLSLIDAQARSVGTAILAARESREKMILEPFAGSRRSWSIWLFAGIVTLIEGLSMTSLGGVDVRSLLAAFFAYFTAFQNGLEPFYPGQQVIGLFSHAFLHANPLHLGFNLLVLFLFGAPVLRLLDLLGRQGRSPARLAPAFWLVFFLGAALGALATGWVKPQTWIVGASGGVFAIFGLWAGLEFRLRRALDLPPGRFRRLAIEMALLNTAIPVVFFLLSPEAGTGIAWQAHVVGFVLGLSAACLIPLSRYASEKGDASGPV